MRRDDLREGDKIKSVAISRREFLEEKVVQILSEIQHGMYAEAKERLDANIRRDVTDWAGIEAYYAGGDDEFKGWLRVSWSKPTGAGLDAVDTKLKALKLTIRNAPLDQPETFAPCIFTGEPGVEEILIGRSY
jgi:prolyl-tRNA synthetase